MKSQIFVLAVSVVALVAGVSVDTSVNNNYMGQSCGASGRRCLLEEAFCNTTTNRCQCNGGTVGNGNLYCFEGGYSCGLLNDPTAFTVDNQAVDLPLPCRFLLSHVVTDITNADRTGTCDLKVYAVNERILGKFFTAGFDLHVSASYDGYAEPYDFGFRALGRGRNGFYQYKLWQTQTNHDNFSRWTLNTNSPRSIRGSMTIFTVMMDMRVHLYIPACGVRIYFRPAESDLGKNQVRVPGLAVNYFNENNPTFESPHDVVCLNPGYRLASVSEPLEVDDVEAMVYRALKTQVPQSFLRNAEPECTALGATIASCNPDNVKAALNMCSFMLDPHFTNCWNRDAGIYGSSESLFILNRCYEAFCTRSTNKCISVINEVIASPCSARTPEVFRDFRCTFDGAM